MSSEEIKKLLIDILKWMDSTGFESGFNRNEIKDRIIGALSKDFRITNKTVSEMFKEDIIERMK